MLLHAWQLKLPLSAGDLAVEAPLEGENDFISLIADVDRVEIVKKLNVAAEEVAAFKYSF
jgi:hypothetical protein